MDALTHFFLPLTAAYVIVGERVPTWFLLPLCGVALLPDLDKFLGAPGLLHSLLTLAPLAGAIVVLEWRARRTLVLSTLVLALLGSHLLLDLLDGGPIPLLYPVVDGGVGLTYPGRAVFGTGLLGVDVEGPLVALRTATPRQGFNAYGFVTGFGVVSALLFGTIVAGRRHAPRRREGESA